MNASKPKKCPRCGGTYPLWDFCRNASRGDGHSAYCKACSTQYNQARRLGVANVSYLPVPSQEDMRRRAAARRALEARRDERGEPDYF